MVRKLRFMLLCFLPAPYGPTTLAGRSRRGLFPYLIVPPSTQPTTNDERKKRALHRNTGTIRRRHGRAATPAACRTVVAEHNCPSGNARPTTTRTRPPARHCSARGRNAERRCHCRNALLALRAGPHPQARCPAAFLRRAPNAPKSSQVQPTTSSHAPAPCYATPRRPAVPPWSLPFLACCQGTHTYGTTRCTRTGCSASRATRPWR